MSLRLTHQTNARNDLLTLAASLETMTPVEPYDLIFLDAQKSGYPTYLSTILSRSQPGSTNRLLRPGGLIIADNALSRGLVADPSDDNPWAAVQRAEWESAADPAATSQGDVAPARFAGNGVVGYGKSEFARSDDIARLDEFNRAMAASERLESLMLPVWDGLALARMVD